jgi:dolichol-phosphate mannosyltransferase
MIYILIPFYNEEKNLPYLINSLSLKLENKNVFYVFSDDGSSDKSIEIIKSNIDHSNLKIISDGINHGPGHAFEKGFEWIINNSIDESDIVVTMESDSTSDVNILENMLQINNLGYDLVLASVYAQGGGFDKTSFFRKLISSVANLLFRYFFNLKVLTLSSFYRVYNVSLLRKIKNEYGIIIKEKGFICMLEILLKSVNVNAKIIEVPMVLKSDLRQGKSKLKIIKTAYAYFKFLIRNINTSNGSKKNY